MQKRNMNLVVGVVILLAIALLIGGVRFLSDAKFRNNTYDLPVLFDNIGTLTEGDPVKINGVKKGKVKKIELKGHRVLVVMAIDKKVQIAEDSRIVIQNIGLMGERMIGVQLGTGKPIAPGTIIVGEFDSGIAEAMGMLGEVLVQVQGTVKDLQKVVENTVGDKEFAVTFRNIMDRLDNTTKILNGMIVYNKDALQGTIGDLTATASDVREFFENNKDRLNHTVTNVEEITIQTKDMLEKAKRISSNIEELVAMMNSDKSSVGRMLADTAFVNDLKTTMLNADSLIRQIRKKGVKVGFW